MRAERLLPIGLLLALGCTDLGAPSEEPAPPVAAEAAPVNDDLDALKAMLGLPDGARAATFRVERLGTARPSVPGPSDYRLDAWVEIAPDQWATVDALYGAPRPARSEAELTAEEAELLPPHLRESAESDGTVRLGGPVYVPSGNEGRGWRIGVIIRVGDEGLWMTAITS